MAKTIQCRAHGGTFTIVPRRGRPPVNCSTDNPCSRAGTDSPQATPAQVARAADKAMNAPTKLSQLSINQLRAYARKQGYSSITKLTEKPALVAAIRKMEAKPTAEAPVEPPESPVEPPTVSKAQNPSLPLALAAKARLEALDWTCKGKGSGLAAEIVASRGEETLILVWDNGVCVGQDYSLWDVDTPKLNGKPASKLSFDPDECTDRELVRALSGMKVTWWNKLAQADEVAVIGANKITIEHRYAGNGDESPGDRIVKFVDHSSSHFKAFRVAALLKVG